MVDAVARPTVEVMEGDIAVNDRCTIPAHEVSWRFTPSGGPGGQHANRSSTRAEATFDIASSQALTDDQRAKMIAVFGVEIRVVVDDHRSQLRNRELAAERLGARLASALVVAPKRKKTKPSKGAKRRRLDSKRRRSETKANRRRPRHDD